MTDSNTNFSERVSYSTFFPVYFADLWLILVCGETYCLILFRRWQDVWLPHLSELGDCFHCHCLPGCGNGIKNYPWLKITQLRLQKQPHLQFLKKHISVFMSLW